jgi:single-stranded DNA-specific DHH superfamily exonuclease
VTIRAERFENSSDSSPRTLRKLQTEDFFPEFEYDEAVAFRELSVDVVRALKRLAPFGEGNPEPVFRFNKSGSRR